MDDFTKNWLNEIGFHHLINTFEEEEINKTALMMLTELMLIELIPKIGQRAVFINELGKLKEHKELEKDVIQFEKETPLTLESLMNMNVVIENTDISYRDTEQLCQNKVTDTLVINTDSNCSDISNSNEATNDFSKARSSINDNFIKNILEKYQDGIHVLEYYYSNGFLSTKMRNRLCGVLIKHEIYNSDAYKINKFQFSKIAKGIEELFPTENEHVYFIPYYKEGNKVSPNRGKLYDKYCYIRKEIRSLTKNDKNSCDEENEIIPNDEAILDSINWLKHNIEPELTLHQLWTETANYRLHKLINMDTIIKYPALKNPKGHVLIDMDFTRMFSEKNEYLLQKFDVFKEKLKIYLKNRNIELDLNSQKISKRIISPDKIGDDDLACIQILPYLFKTVVIKVPKKGPDDTNLKYCIRRPSKLEQADAVVVNIINPNDLKTVHEQKVNRAFSLGLTVQPYIAIVGNPNVNSLLNYYTVFNDIYYKLETPIKALDICFKAFHVFNLKYPQEAEQVWWFIEEYFLNICDKSKKKFLGVQSLIKDLQ